jgi:hypothetical protein
MDTLLITLISLLSKLICQIHYLKSTISLHFFGHCPGMPRADGKVRLSIFSATVNSAQRSKIEKSIPGTWGGGIIDPLQSTSTGSTPRIH